MYPCFIPLIYDITENTLSLCDPLIYEIKGKIFSFRFPYLRYKCLIYEIKGKLHRSIKLIYIHKGLSISPDTFQIIEQTVFLVKDMYDHIAKV